MTKRLLATAARSLPYVRRVLEHRDRAVAQNHRLREQVDLLTKQRDAAQREADKLALGLVPSHAAEPLDDLQVLFIVTYGRSGSTLLMSLLDSLPGYVIRGENAGVLYHLYEFHAKALSARDKWAKDKPLPPQHPWYGIDDYPQSLALARMRQLVVDTIFRPEPDTRVTGMKEIRWWMPNIPAYLDFLETLFPRARFLLNTRNLKDVARSRWYAKNPDALAHLTDLEARLTSAVASRGDRGYHIHYDDYIRDPTVLRGLFEWLGEEYEPDRVARILATKHSF